MEVSTTVPAPQWTNRDGSPLALGMTFSAPHIVIRDGMVIADYGGDEAGALEHYEKLVATRRRAMGRTQARVLM